MTKNRKILALLAAIPLTIGAATLAHADEAVSDTRISNHGVPPTTAPMPIYSGPVNGSFGAGDTGRVSAHETNPTNPGNTSNYNPPPMYVSPGTPYPVYPGTPSYAPPGSAGPEIQIISNEPYFQDDVPPYRR